MYIIHHIHYLVISVPYIIQNTLLITIHSPYGIIRKFHMECNALELFINILLQSLPLVSACRAVLHNPTPQFFSQCTSRLPLSSPYLNPTARDAPKCTDSLSFEQIFRRYVMRYLLGREIMLKIEGYNVKLACKIWDLKFSPHFLSSMKGGNPENRMQRMIILYILLSGSPPSSMMPRDHQSTLRL